MTPTSATETMTQTSAEQRSSDQADAIVRFTRIFLKRNLQNCAGASTRQSGLNEKRLQMHLSVPGTSVTLWT